MIITPEEHERLAPFIAAARDCQTRAGMQQAGPIKEIHVSPQMFGKFIVGTLREPFELANVLGMPIKLDPELRGCSCYCRLNE